MRDVSLIIVAGGIGKRFQNKIPKQFFKVNDKPLIHYCLESFLQCEEIAEIIIVADSSYHDLFKNHLVKLALPGKERQDSLASGLEMVSPSLSWICVHDGARPIIKPSMIARLISEGKEYGAAALGIPARLTIKEVLEDQMVSKTLKRNTLWEIQTPQFAKKDFLIQGLKKAQEKNISVTDDVSLVELLGLPVKMVQGEISNIKVTHPEDLPLVLHYLNNRPLS